jgi:predicted nucleic-acid-binding Zn-ribbon protein
MLMAEICKQCGDPKFYHGSIVLRPLPVEPTQCRKCACTSYAPDVDQWTVDDRFNQVFEELQRVEDLVRAVLVAVEKLPLTWRR